MSTQPVVIEPCPRCGKGDFRTVAGRNVHLSRSHGVRGANYKYNKHGKNKHALVKVHKGELQHGQPRQTAQTAHNHETTQEHNLSNHFACAFGIVQSKLESYAAHNAVPYTVLAEGVAALLRGKTGR